MKKAAILITPKVRVPVLSVQTLFTFPIASDLSKCLTKLCSFFILSTEKAKAIVTAIGNPSGIATTMTVTAIMNALTKISSSREENIGIPAYKFNMVSLVKRTAPMRMAKVIPKLPIIFDKSFNCFFNGVKFVSSSSSSPSFLPLELNNCLF